MAVKFDIRSSIDGGICRVVVAGELDLATAPELVRVLDGVEAGTTPVQIDLSDVSFIDATGLRALLRAQARFGPGVELTAPSRPVRRLFELLGMGRRLDPPRPDRRVAASVPGASARP